MMNSSLITHRSSFIFISDLHLGSRGDGDRRARFFQFLNVIRGRTSSLFIVGDLFEFGFEFRGRTLQRNIPIAEQLAEVVRAGVKVVLVKGNHDSWLGKSLHESYGIELMEQPAVVELDGRKVHMIHGDAIDPSFLTRLTRRLFQSRRATALYSLLPERIGVRLAGMVARMSRARGERPSLMLCLERYAGEQLTSGCDIVVAGHVHRPLLKRIGSGWYLNTGDWIRHFSYAVLDKTGLRLETFQGMQNAECRMQNAG
jgi:UDP-2,3-diacylglucosamine hydrolase